MRVLCLIPVLFAAACVPAVPAPPPLAPTPVPIAPVARPLAADWRDWPRSAGVWRYHADARVARFGTGAVPGLTLRCDRAARAVVIDVPGATALTVRTTSATRMLAARAGGAALAATDPLLDAMAFSRGRFVIEQPGRPPLVVPADAEVGRVVQDCRD